MKSFNRKHDEFVEKKIRQVSIYNDRASNSLPSPSLSVPDIGVAVHTGTTGGPLLSNKMNDGGGDNSTHRGSMTSSSSTPVLKGALVSPKKKNTRFW
mmetsp:Transcript_14538/g.32014  ORF Transcript_14538/g.32014 Transcript_14538/m.32014 type:complete len:97 (+) Transcript_14538:627-917(+)